MSMRRSSKYSTTCEVYRLINDLCQSDSEKDNEIRDLCVLGMIVGKILSLEVSKERVNAIAQARSEIKNFIQVKNKRMQKEYKHNWKNRDKIKEEWGIE